MLEFKLRPHHALCICFFEGKGYSEEFTRNMYTTIDGLRLNPTVEIVCKADMLCEKCPKLCGDDCINCEESVTALDGKVMELCGFSDGDKLTAMEFFAAAREKIIDAGKMEYVCGGCSWSEICFRHTVN